MVPAICRHMLQDVRLVLRQDAICRCCMVVLQNTYVVVIDRKLARRFDLTRSTTFAADCMLLCEDTKDRVPTANDCSAAYLKPIVVARVIDVMAQSRNQHC